MFLKLLLTTLVSCIISQLVEEFSLHIILSRSEGIKFREKIVFDPERMAVKKITREIPAQTCSFDNLVIQRTFKHDFSYYPHMKVPFGDSTQITIFPKKDFFEGKTVVNIEYACKKFWSYSNDLAQGTLYVKGFYLAGLPQKTEILIYRAKRSKSEKKLKVRHSCGHDPNRPPAPFTGLTSINCLLMQNSPRRSACSIKEKDLATAVVAPSFPISPDQTLIVSMSGPKENFYFERSPEEEREFLGWFIFISAVILGGWGCLIAIGIINSRAFRAR